MAICRSVRPWATARATDPVGSDEPCRHGSGAAADGEAVARIGSSLEFWPHEGVVAVDRDGPAIESAVVTRASLIRSREVADQRLRGEGHGDTWVGAGLRVVELGEPFDAGLVDGHHPTLLVEDEAAMA